MQFSFLLTLAAAVSAAELGIEVTRKVNCERKSKSGDDIQMEYTGRLADKPDDPPFDSSLNPGRSPLPFKLGAGQVIKGWDQGLLDMCVGEARTLTIPPGLAYGERGIGPIPGGATLVFTTRLISIKGVEDTVDTADYVDKEPKEEVEEAKEEAKEEVKEEEEPVVPKDEL